MIKLAWISVEDRNGGAVSFRIEGAGVDDSGLYYWWGRPCWWRVCNQGDCHATDSASPIFVDPTERPKHLETDLSAPKANLDGQALAG